MALQPTPSVSPKELPNAMAPSMTSCRRLALTKFSDSSNYQIEASVRVIPRGPSITSTGMLKRVCHAHYGYHYYSKAETLVLRSPISDLS